jgi:hypothetical protein
MFPPVETKNAPAVAQFVEEKFALMHPGASLSWLQSIFRDIEILFSGQHPDYAQVDLRYHDLEHTLQATVCMVLLLEGRHAAGVEAVLGAINCTGPTKEISRLKFRDPYERVIGCALATADYLGQMAAEDYPDELEILFHEFKESDDFIRLPPSRRAFKAKHEVAERTPLFWKKFVQPKLEGDFQAVYRFLSAPYPHGPNPYLEAIEKNIETIRRRSAAKARRSVKKK